MTHSKSETSAKAVQVMNPNMRIKAYTTKVCPETEDVFGEDFWTSVDGVCNALDNIHARLYVDAKCAFYGKSLLESGTLGTKGNTQVMVPHVTQTYGETTDPEPKETAKVIFSLASACFFFSFLSFTRLLFFSVPFAQLSQQH